MSFEKKRENRVHRFDCTNCSGSVSVDFSLVKKGHKAICRNCGAEYPFNESDERLIRKVKKPI